MFSIKRQVIFSRDPSSPRRTTTILVAKSGSLVYPRSYRGLGMCAYHNLYIYGDRYDNAVGRNDSMDLTIIFIKLITLIDPPVHMVALCVVSSPRDCFRIKALGSFTPGQQSRECVN